MGRCNDTLLRAINVKKINKESDYVEFRVHKDLDSCKRINTKNFTSISGDYMYKKFFVPADAFECKKSGCVNTGTLMFGTATDSVVYNGKWDATDFATGAITMYVKADEAITGTMKFHISSDLAFTDSDVYTLDLAELKKNIDGNGFIPVVVDLTSEPTSTTGAGWSASNTGAYFKVEEVDVSAEVGISSISVYDDIEAFETNDVVIVSCLSSIDGTIDIGAIDATCWESGYDTEGLSFERTVVGNSVSANYWKLNPLMGKGNAVNGSETRVVTKEISMSADGLYGEIVLADANAEECAGIKVQLADACDVSSADLTILSIPTPTNLDEAHFQRLVQEDGSTRLIFNTNLVGENALVSYPVKVEVEEFVADKKNIGSVETEMRYTETLSDGTKIINIFPKVLVTSFPASIGTEETEFSFTINIQAEGGVYYKQHKIVG